uniref:Uncharacterized protein n=1 Tax=Helianthus annuus TaxID=4232 RepID=A0A251T1S0_HELAN
MPQSALNPYNFVDMPSSTLRLLNLVEGWRQGDSRCCCSFSSLVLGSYFSTRCCCSFSSSILGSYFSTWKVGSILKYKRNEETYVWLHFFSDNKHSGAILLKEGLRF